MVKTYSLAKLNNLIILVLSNYNRATKQTQNNKEIQYLSRQTYGMKTTYILVKMGICINLSMYNKDKQHKKSPYVHDFEQGDLWYILDTSLN